MSRWDRYWTDIGDDEEYIPMSKRETTWRVTWIERDGTPGESTRTGPHARYRADQDARVIRRCGATNIRVTRV